jgi:hypothetical protein
MRLVWSKAPSSTTFVEENTRGAADNAQHPGEAAAVSRVGRGGPGQA